MRNLLGIHYGPATERLLQEAREQIPELSIAPSSTAPEHCRRHRGAWDHSTKTLYLNTDRPDTDEHTICHELGHALIWARGGWPELNSVTELFGNESELYGLAGPFSNRLQHIALEKILLEAGCETSGGHRMRIERDIDTLVKEIREGAEPANPGMWYQRAFKYAETKFCAAPEDHAAWASALGENCPHALNLGRELVQSIRGNTLGTVAAARKGIEKWMVRTDRFLKRTGAKGFPSPIDRFAVNPIVLPAKTMTRSPAQIFDLRISKSQEPNKMLVAARVHGDPLLCVMKRVNVPPEMTKRGLAQHLLALPFEKFAALLKLEVIAE